MSNDAELLRRYAEAADERAFAQFVQRNLPLVYSAALRRMGGDAAGAADVAQQVFISTARRARRLARHTGLTGWLYTATRNAALNHMRDEQCRRRREHEAHAARELLAPAQSKAAAEWEMLRPVLDEAIDELGERDREAVLMRFFENRPFAEIARRLRLTENAARMRVERALDKLHALLARRGVTSTSGALGLMLASQATAVAVPAGLAASVTSGALAGASTAAAVVPLAGALAFMTAKKALATAAVVVLLIAAAGTATWQVHLARKAREALALAAEEQANAARRLDAMGHRAEARETEAADLERRLAAARAAVVERQSRAGEPSVKAVPVKDPQAAGDEFMARHPLVRQALHDYGKARLRFRFGELFDELGLTAAQIDAIAGAYSISMGASAADGSSLSLRSTPMPGTGYSDRLREALGGEEAFKKYIAASQRDAARDLAVKVAGELYHTDTPITPEQADALVQHLMAHRTSGRGWKPQRYDWDAVLKRTATLLSPAQQAAVARMQAKDWFFQALNEPPPASGIPAK